MKFCAKCNQIKSVKYFYKGKYGVFGRQTYCIECLKSPRTKRLELVKKGFKLCSKCGIEKKLSEFSKDKNRKLGFASQCKFCVNEYAKLWYLKPKNKLKTKKRVKIYKLKNKEKIQKRNREYSKEYILKYNHNITLKEYNNLLQKQNSVCAICENKEIRKQNKRRSRLSVDHNHKTGKIRGLLCCNCNQGLGKFKDNIKILQNAINYLNKEE